MKISVIVVRVLIGALLLVSTIGYFFKLFPQPELSDDAMKFMIGLDASEYLMPLVKSIELLCAISFFTNRFVPLAVVVIFPITLNILLYHAFMAPESMIMQVFLFVGNIFLAYAHRDHYRSVLAVK